MSDASTTEHLFGGPWTEIKLEAIEYYLQCYSKALKAFGFKLTYVDAFAGTGFRDAVVEKGGLLDGTPVHAVRLSPDRRAERSEWSRALTALSLSRKKTIVATP